MGKGKRPNGNRNGGGNGNGTGTGGQGAPRSPTARSSDKNQHMNRQVPDQWLDRGKQKKDFDWGHWESRYGTYDKHSNNPKSLNQIQDGKYNFHGKLNDPHAAAKNANNPKQKNNNNDPFDNNNKHNNNNNIKDNNHNNYNNKNQKSLYSKGTDPFAEDLAKRFRIVNDSLDKEAQEAANGDVYMRNPDKGYNIVKITQPKIDYIDEEEEERRIEQRVLERIAKEYGWVHPQVNPALLNNASTVYGSSRCGHCDGDHHQTFCYTYLKSHFEGNALDQHQILATAANGDTFWISEREFNELVARKIPFTPHADKQQTKCKNCNKIGHLNRACPLLQQQHLYWIHDINNPCSPKEKHDLFPHLIGPPIEEIIGETCPHCGKKHLGDCDEKKTLFLLDYVYNRMPKLHDDGSKDYYGRCSKCYRDHDDLCSRQLDQFRDAHVALMQVMGRNPSVSAHLCLFCGLTHHGICDTMCQQVFSFMVNAPQWKDFKDKNNGATYQWIKNAAGSWREDWWNAIIPYFTIQHVDFSKKLLEAFTW